jgi:hypothetical protein
VYGSGEVLDSGGCKHRLGRLRMVAGGHIALRRLGVIASMRAALGRL